MSNLDDMIREGDRIEFMEGLIKVVAGTVHKLFPLPLSEEWDRDFKSELGWRLQDYFNGVKIILKEEDTDATHDL